jgi:disulfide bond formation protein DsbB
MTSSSARLAAFVILAASAAVLGGALLFEHVGGLSPCTLCLYERWPYKVAIALSLVALTTGARPATRWIVVLCAGLFAAGVFLAFYHVGVEQHWFAGPSACTANDAPADSVEALKAQIMGKKPVRCDEVPWALFGVSLAGWNLLASAALALYCLATFRRLGAAPRHRKAYA